MLLHNLWNVRQSIRHILPYLSYAHKLIPFSHANQAHTFDKSLRRHAAMPRFLGNSDMSSHMAKALWVHIGKDQ